MISFTDNVVLSINDTRTLSTDIVYFDISKAFDSRFNFDKLKNLYSIDGILLKFLKNYLCEREQSVVLDGVKSSSKPVLSGVPQGFVCKIPLIARALGLKAKRARDNRVSCIQPKDPF